MSISRNDRRHQFACGAEVMRHEFGLYFGALYCSFMIACLTGLGTYLFSANAALSDDEGRLLSALRTDRRAETAHHQQGRTPPFHRARVTRVTTGLIKRRCSPLIGKVTMLRFLPRDTARIFRW